jgi:hypothetical protein
MAVVSLLQFNNYLDELPIPSLVATAGGQNLDKALAHAYENTRDFLRKGFGMQVRKAHFLTRPRNLCAVRFDVALKNDSVSCEDYQVKSQNLSP